MSIETERRLRAPRNFWDRWDAMCQRDGLGKTAKAFMALMLIAIEKSEERADAKQSKEGNAE